MKKTIYINQEKAIEWGLSFPEASIIDLFCKLPLWADGKQREDWKIRYFFAKPKILKELPLLNCELDTVYRYCKKLVEKWIIGFKKDGHRDFWTLESKIKEWDFDSSEINPRKRQNLGNKSELVCRKIFRDIPDLNPTDKISILLDLWLDKETVENLENFSPSFFITYSKFEKHCEAKGKSITAEQRSEILKQCIEAWELKTNAWLKYSISKGYYSLFFEENGSWQRKKWVTQQLSQDNKISFSDQEKELLSSFLSGISDLYLKQKIEQSAQARKYNLPLEPLTVQNLEIMKKHHEKT